MIRREFRLNEGDAFNALKVKRSQDRIQSLGFFQDKLEDQADRGLDAGPGRCSGVNVEEKPTGQLSLSGGYSSLEKFVVSACGRAEQFHGQGRSRFGACVNWSRYSKSVELGFTDPYFLDKQILLGGDLFRQRLSAASIYIGTTRNTTYSQAAARAAIVGWASRSPNIGSSARATR